MGLFKRNQRNGYQPDKDPATTLPPNGGNVAQEESYSSKLPSNVKMPKVVCNETGTGNECKLLKELRSLQEEISKVEIELVDIEKYCKKYMKIYSDIIISDIIIMKII